MNDERFSEAESIFHAAAYLPREKREPILSELCGGNTRLRAFVEQLLEGHDRGESFLQSPADEVESATIAEDHPDVIPSIGTYRILETIGEGGMGTVYAAEQTEPVRRKVAVKVIKPGMDSKQAIARFEAERQALALMDHPNIAKVLDAGETQQGRLYFVMDLVKGEPITDYCDRNALSTKERLRLFVSVCHAVQHAHQKGIIHRDLKPSNILVSLLDRKPLPKIIDFGIAKATSAPLTESTLHTQQGQLIGTPAYMSPEQADIGPLEVDTRSDIYSLGVVLYELLTGALPFDPETWRKIGLAEFQRIIRDEEPPRPSTKVSTAGDASKEIARRHHTDPQHLFRQLRGELDWIVLKAIEKDPARRYETANGLANDIERFLNDEAVLARPPSTAYRFRKFAKRHVTALAFGTAVFLGLNLALFESNRQRMRTEAALAKTEVAQVDAEEARDESEAVTQFLMQMLWSVQPEQLGRDVTVQEVLEEAAKTVGDKFADRPLIAAKLRTVIGVTYNELGEFAVAAPHLEQAVDVRRRLLGPDHLLTLRSSYHLAYSYGMSERTEEATALLEDVLERQGRALGEEHDDTRQAAHLLILLYKDQRRYPEAESLALRSIETWRQILGEDALYVDTFRYALALVYERQGRHEEAGSLIRPILERARTTLGDDHSKTLEFKAVLARQCTAMRRFAEAEPLLLEVLDGRRRVEGPRSTWTMRTMRDLADLYARMGRYDEAEQLHRQAIGIGVRARGEEETHTLAAKAGLARMWMNQKRYAEAESLFTEVAKVRRRVQGEGHPETIQSRFDLATAHARQGRYEKAERIGLEILEAQRQAPGDVHEGLQASYYGMACLASLRGDRVKALDWLRQCVEHGYSNVDRLLQDPDLGSLLGDPDFEALVADLGRLAQSAPKRRTGE